MRPILRPAYWNEKNLDVWRKRTVELINIATLLPVVYCDLMIAKEKNEKRKIKKLERERSGLDGAIGRILDDATTDEYTIKKR